MTLLQCVKENRDLLQEGIAYIAFYKTGRQWHTKEFWKLYDLDDYDPQEVSDIKEIIKIDPNAMIFNGYDNCFYTEELNQQELYQLIKNFYEEEKSKAIYWL